MADPTSLPESAWHWIGAFVGSVLTILVGIIGWNFADVKKKGEDNSKAIGDLKLEAAKFAIATEVSRDYVSREDFSAMEVKVAGLVSRRELIAYMRAHRDEQAQRDKQQERQHIENKDVMKDIKEA